MIDLDEILAKWCVPCGTCDFGLVEYGCTCPQGDYRLVMLKLVDEIRRLRGATDEAS